MASKKVVKKKEVACECPDQNTKCTVSKSTWKPVFLYKPNSSTFYRLVIENGFKIDAYGTKIDKILDILSNLNNRSESTMYDVMRESVMITIPNINFDNANAMIRELSRHLTRHPEGSSKTDALGIEIKTMLMGDDEYKIIINYTTDYNDGEIVKYLDFSDSICLKSSKQINLIGLITHSTCNRNFNYIIKEKLKLHYDDDYCDNDGIDSLTLMGTAIGYCIGKDTLLSNTFGTIYNSTLSNSSVYNTNILLFNTDFINSEITTDKIHTVMGRLVYGNVDTTVSSAKRSLIRNSKLLLNDAHNYDTRAVNEIHNITVEFKMSPFFLEVYNKGLWLVGEEPYEVRKLVDHIDDVKENKITYRTVGLMNEDSMLHPVRILIKSDKSNKIKMAVWNFVDHIYVPLETFIAEHDKQDHSKFVSSISKYNVTVLRNFMEMVMAKLCK